MTEVLKHKNLYLEQFESFAGSAPLLHTRRAALDRFLALGFPSRRDEEWRFTNVAPIAGTPFRRATRDGAQVQLKDLETFAGWPRLVFVNGHFEPRLSEGAPDKAPHKPPHKANWGSLAEASAIVSEHLARYAGYDDDAFAALNTAFMADGAFVVVPRGLDLAPPIHVLFVATDGADPVASYPRCLIVAEADSRATIVEEYCSIGDAVCLTNAVTEIVAGPNAAVDHYKLQRETSYHVGLTHIQQDRDSSVSSHVVTLDGALVRNNITCVLDGHGAHGALDGLYVASGTQHVDNHLKVEHAQPHCDSREFFKGILDGKARAVFSGRIIVHKDAQKTDAKQTNMNLLLSEEAKVDTKPQLEIFADDVKCTHGATIGQIDESAIFYMQSRGISEAAARGVLIHAFAGESLDRIKPDPLRRRLKVALDTMLPLGLPGLREAG